MGEGAPSVAALRSAGEFVFRVAKWKQGRIGATGKVAERVAEEGRRWGGAENKRFGERVNAENRGLCRRPGGTINDGGVKLGLGGGG